nr:hypothetical protein Iba_chr01cCG4830 [Ipomoea batatas]
MAYKVIRCPCSKIIGYIVLLDESSSLMVNHSSLLAAIANEERRSLEKVTGMVPSPTGEGACHLLQHLLQLEKEAGIAPSPT